MIFISCCLRLRYGHLCLSVQRSVADVYNRCILCNVHAYFVWIVARDILLLLLLLLL